MTVDSQRRSGEIGIPVMRMMCDARINLVWEGTSEILRIWMAREGLAPYIEQALALLSGTFSQWLAVPFYYGRMGLRSMSPFSRFFGESKIFGPEYAQWVRCIESSARRLTRVILGATIRHRQSLHHKQLLLQDIVEGSLGLFPMAATIWYASQPSMRGKPGIQALADYLCQEMAGRLHPEATRVGRHKRDADVYRLSKAIMNGEYDWLEDGTLPLLRNETERRTL